MKRWIDLSAHGMRLRLAILPNAKVLVLEGGEKDEKAAAALGFTRRPSGAWIRANNIDVNPREFMRILPQLVIRDMPDDEIVMTAAVPGKGAPGVDHQTASPAAPSIDPRFLGLNRFGQEVYELDGARYAIDQRGRRTFESQIAAPVPGVFLRAVDAGSLTMCSEGFLEQCLSTKHSNPDFEAFIATIRSSGFEVSREDLGASLRTASVRHVLRKGDATLRDRFGKAIAIESGLAPVVGDGHDNLPISIAVRRMLGTDPELIGKTIALIAVNDGGAVRSLFPKGSREAADTTSADLILDFSRDSSSDLISRLKSRSDNSRTIAVLRPEASDLRAIQREYHVEAAGLITAEAGGPAFVVSIGARLDAPKEDPAPFVVATINDHAALWTFASDVALMRSRVSEALRTGLATEAELGATDPSLFRNDFQVPYVSASKAQPSTMVPKDLDGPTRQALSRVVSNYGDVEHKVAIEFGFADDQIQDRLAAEQIDALALYLHAEERGRDFLVADGAGVGKGRTLAAIAKRSVLQRRKVLVLTEKEINLGDFHRDVTHIGADDIIRPVIMNEGASLIDERTGAEFPVGDRAPLKEALARSTWPEGVDVIYATYSQFNRSEEESDRSAWLRSAIDDDVVLILDECHNAAGDSNISNNFSEAMGKAGSVVLSSATFAANPKMIAFYERLFPVGITGEEISEMMRKGGEQFQEVVSAMLVADGVMIRREQDLSQIEFVSVVDHARVERNRSMMDQLAAVVSEMASLSGDLDAWVNNQNERNAANGIKSIQLSRLNFGSPLYTMTRLFSAAVLAELSSERAITALQNGEKPVILVENTIQTILDEAAEAGGDAPDFKAIVHRILNQMTSVRAIDANGAEQEHADPADLPLFDQTVIKIRKMIDELPELPASAIDEVKGRIEAAGFTCGEITGRTMEIRNGKVVPRKDRNRIRVKNAFNSGELDGLIINVAGSTGIDMHASRRFKDRRRRVMIEHQGPSHVLRQIQAYFRVSRRDQESAPRIEMLSSGLPAESRLAAMRNQKLRRLSANVSSNRDSAFLMRNIPDLLNPVGDTVISRYAEMRPDLLQRLHLDYETEERSADEEAGEKKDTDYTANEFLARLMLLPTAAQEKVLGELTNEYLAHIAELEARGDNPLRPREMEGIVHIRQSRVFESGGVSSNETVFDAPLHLTDVMIERVAECIRSEQVVEAVDAGGALYERVLAAVTNLENNQDVFLEPYLPKSARTVADAIASGSKRIIALRQQMGDMIAVLRQIAPGREIPRPFGDEGERAIITSISPPSPGFEHMPGMYVVEFTYPGAIHLQRIRLDTLLRNEGVVSRVDGALKVNVSEGLEGNDYDRILAEFETAIGKRLTSGRVLTSNIFRAVRLATEHKLGSLVSFVDTDGVRHRGVLVRKDFERRLDQLSLRIDGVDAVFAAVTDMRAEVNTSAGSPSKGVLISPLSSDRFSIRIPAPAGRRAVWPSSSYRDLYELGDKDPKGRSRVEISGQDNLRDVLEILCEAGIATFYASPKHRSGMESFITQDARSPLHDTSPRRVA